MARALRIEYAGALYHVMSRGDHGEDIWRDAEDRRRFLELLGEACEASGWVVHSYVLMRNHYHLLLETQRATLVRGMQQLQSAYTQSYNRRHKLRGHLFQGRYKSVVIQERGGGYFQRVSDYIHLNPVRACVVSSPKQWLEWEWSSARFLLERKRPEWLRWERVGEALSIRKWDATGRKKYRAWLEEKYRTWEGEADSWKAVRRGWALGSEDFVDGLKDKVSQKLEGKQTERWKGEAVLEAEETLAERMLQEAAQSGGVKTAAELSRMKRLRLAQDIRSRTRVKLGWLAPRLGYKTSGGLASSLYAETRV